MVDLINRDGDKTSEFWLTVLAVVAVAVNAILRSVYGVGMTELELGYIAALTGSYGFGRYGLKKAVAYTKNGAQ